MLVADRYGFQSDPFGWPIGAVAGTAVLGRSCNEFSEYPDRRSCAPFPAIQAI